MSTPMIIRRFRKELRGRADIQPNGTVQLRNDPIRKNNTRAAELLLREVFAERITIEYSSEGIICGSREEAAILRLQEYTQEETTQHDMLLAEIPAQELAAFLTSKDEPNDIYIPSSPEQIFVAALTEDFADITYSL